MKEKQETWRFCFDALWMYEKGTDSFSDTKVQSKVREEYICMQLNSIE